MSNGAAPVPTPPQRTIGEILLAHGYVTQEQLDNAVERQRQTGFPLGQILVEAGAISRLELASALAVQWSDLPISSGPDRGDRRSVPLTAQGPAPKHPPTSDSRVEELNSTVRALGARLVELESAVESAQGAADDERLEDVSAALAQLEQRLAVSESLLAELASRPAPVELDVLDGRLAPLAGSVETTLSRTQALEDHLDALATQLDEVARGVERVATDLGRRSAGFAEQLAALVARIDSHTDTGGLDELRAELRELRDRPASDPTLAERLDGLAAQVWDGLAGLRERTDELAARPAGDQGLVARVDELARRLGSLPEADQLEELRHIVAAVSERPSADPVLAARVEELSARVEALTQRSDPMPVVADRLARLEHAIAERPSIDPALTARLDEVADRVHELGARPVHDEALGARVDALAAALDRLAEEARAHEHAPPDELARVLAGVDGLAARVASLEQTGLVETFDSGPELEARIDAAARAVDRLAADLATALDSWRTERSALEARLDELDARPERAADASALPPATTVPGVEVSDQDLNRLWFAVERISLQLTEHHRDIELVLGRTDMNEKLEELQSRLDEVEDRALGAPQPAAPSSEDGEAAGHAESGMGSRALERKLHELQKASREDREKILSQIEQMIGSLEWRLQRLESGATAKPLGS